MDWIPLKTVFIISLYWDFYKVDFFFFLSIFRGGVEGQVLCVVANLMVHTRGQQTFS